MSIPTRGTKRGLYFLGIALLVVFLLSATFLYVVPYLQRGSVFGVGTGQALQAGFAACSGVSNPTTGFSANGGSPSPPSTCLNTPQNLAITLVDAGNLATKLSGWSASLISMGGYGNTAPLGSVVDSCTNTSTNGVCTFSATGYNTGAAYSVWLCHKTTAPATGCYAQQVTTYQTPLPGLAGLPGGTVPFFQGTTTPNTTPTTGFLLPVLQTPGDQGTTNTPITLGNFQFNGTAIATGSTCFQNQAKGTNPCYLGSGSQTPTFTFTLTNTFQGTIPYKSGATPSPKLDIANRGPFTEVLTMEEKQVAGSDPIPPLTAGSFGTSSVATKQGSVPDVFFVTSDQSAALTNYVQQGPVVVSLGQQSYTFSINAIGMSTSGDKTSFTINLYQYFSLTYFVGPGGLFNGFNTEAVTQMTQYVFTLQTP